MDTLFPLGMYLDDRTAREGIRKEHVVLFSRFCPLAVSQEICYGWGSEDEVLLAMQDMVPMQRRGGGRGVRPSYRNSIED